MPASHGHPTAVAHPHYQLTSQTLAAAERRVGSLSENAGTRHHPARAAG
ncbi:MAG: hypothetical protein KC418_15085 [Anaerolineales bacterium]|nr:hypothetical protein [Anaerolineales bacterium]MCB8953250.1 hypothetical protein [Ardenticatenales bacterium]